MFEDIDDNTVPKNKYSSFDYKLVYKDTSPSHDHGIWCLTWATTPEGIEILLTGDSDGQGHIWKLKSKRGYHKLKNIWTLTPRANLAIVSLDTVLKNGDTLISASSIDGYIRIYSFTNKKMLVKLHVGHLNNYESKFSPTGEFLATSGQDGKLALYHLSEVLSGETDKPYIKLGEGLQPEYGTISTCLSWGTRGNEIAQGFGGVNPKLLTYDVRDQKQTRILNGTSKHIRKIIYIPGHQKILACSEDQRIHFYDLDQYRTRACGWYWGHTSWVTSIDCSKDQLCVVSCSFDTYLKIWTFKSRENIITLKPGHHKLWDVGYNSTGNVLAVVDDGGWIYLYAVKHPKKTNKQKEENNIPNKNDNKKLNKNPPPRKSTKLKDALVINKEEMLG